MPKYTIRTAGRNESEKTSFVAAWQRSLDVCVLSDLLQGGPHLARPGGYFGAGLLSLDASSVGLAADAAGGSKGATAMHPMHPAMTVCLAI